MTALLAVASASPYLLYSGDAQDADPSQRYYGYYGLGYHGLGYRSANKDIARPSADTSPTVRAYGYGYPYAYGHYGYYG